MAFSLIDAAMQKLTENYVFPDKAAQAAAVIKSRDYEGLSEAELCERVTADLFEVCGDKHLRLRVRARDLQERGQTEEAAIAAWAQLLRSTNYGVSKVERLAGNVGLLDLRLIASPGLGAEAIAAAMRLVSNMDALIVDLRKCRGGNPDGVIFWCSYFFADEDTHLNSIYFAESKLTKQYWSLAWVPGERYLEKPVFVLTSDFTFSGGEEFCYNLQAQKRAVLIGQTTRGGAHPTQAYPLTDTVEITVPNARSINPVTGTNWEGVGVKPDIESDRPFEHAYREALAHVVKASKDQSIVDEAQESLSGLD